MPQRTYKANPVIQTRDAATKRRRDMFFRRVQTGREDKKWEARGEQIQQLDFVSERKRWEAEKARQAPPEENVVDEDFIDDSILPELSYAQRPEQTTPEADYVAAQEEYELQQLIASMERDTDAASQHYGSDDDDYDSIFMECTETTGEEYEYPSQSANNALDAQDAMDVDMMED